MIKGDFLRTVYYILHVQEPKAKGHLSYRDTFSRIVWCPLKTCFTPSLPPSLPPGCIRKNCAVGSSVIISDSERLSSPEVYQMKADIRMQKCGFFYENPTETGLAIKGLTWGLQNGACADSLADAHAATLRAILRYMSDMKVIMNHIFVIK